MQASQSLQVLPAINDQAQFYLGLQTPLAGRASTLYSNPTLTFNPSGNLLSVSSLSISNVLNVGSQIGLGTGSIGIDSTSGAISFLTGVASATISPVALVILPSGGLGYGSSLNGKVSVSSINTAIANAGTSGAPIGSLVKVYNFISTVTVGPGVVRWYPQSGVTLVSCYLTAGTSPSLGNFSINLLKNGTVIQSLTLSSGSYNTGLTALNITATATDYFTVDVIASGGAANGALNIIYQRTS